jgi:diacylglycerol kinase
MVSLNRSDMAGIIKNIAAGAVLVAAIISLIAGLLVFLPYVSAAVKQLLR